MSDIRKKRKKKKVVIFDLQLMKYTSLSTPYPSTAGLIVSGFHKAQGDTIILVDQCPQFTRFDIVYIVKDDVNLYHTPSWLKHHNVIPIGRHWEGGIGFWDKEWEKYPPDMTLYRKWFDSWKSNYPWFGEETRAAIYSYKPVLIKNEVRMLKPTGDKILIIDYNPHEIDEGHEFLKSFDNKEIAFLHWFNITKDVESSFDLLHKDNIKCRTWVTFDLDISKKEMIDLTKAVARRGGHRNNYLLKFTVYFHGGNQEDWRKSVVHILQIINLWKKIAGRRVYSLPIDDLSFECPDLLTHIARWTGTPILFRNFSYIDSVLAFDIPTIQILEDFLRDPHEVWSRKRYRVHPLYIKTYRVFTYLEKYPRLMILLSQFIEGDSD